MKPINEEQVNEQIERLVNLSKVKKTEGLRKSNLKYHPEVVCTHQRPSRTPLHSVGLPLTLTPYPYPLPLPALPYLSYLVLGRITPRSRWVRWKMRS